MPFQGKESRNDYGEVFRPTHRITTGEKVVAVLW